MDTVFEVFLLFCITILIWMIPSNRNQVKLKACSSVTQCEVHGEFKTKASCEEMKVKLEKNDNILEFICEGGDK